MAVNLSKTVRLGGIEQKVEKSHGKPLSEGFKGERKTKRNEEYHLVRSIKHSPLVNQCEVRMDNFAFTLTLRIIGGKNGAEGEMEMIYAFMTMFKQQG